MILALFHAGGKIPFASEELNNLVRKGAITGNALAIMLCGMPSSPLACDLKCDTAKITSASDTGGKLNPSSGAVAKMFRDADGSSVGDMAIREKTNRLS